jgi:hypothetical protein
MASIRKRYTRPITSDIRSPLRSAGTRRPRCLRTCTESWLTRRVDSIVLQIRVAQQESRPTTRRLRGSTIRDVGLLSTDLCPRSASSTARARTVCSEAAGKYASASNLRCASRQLPEKDQRAVLFVLKSFFETKRFRAASRGAERDRCPRPPLPLRPDPPSTSEAVAHRDRSGKVATGSASPNGDSAAAPLVGRQPRSCPAECKRALTIGRPASPAPTNSSPGVVSDCTVQGARSVAERSRRPKSPGSVHWSSFNARRSLITAPVNSGSRPSVVTSPGSADSDRKTCTSDSTKFAVCRFVFLYARGSDLCGGEPTRCRDR